MFFLDRNRYFWQMDVSENSGTPKSSILIGFSIINHPFWGTTIFGNTQIETIFSHWFTTASGASVATPGWTNGGRGLATSTAATCAGHRRGSPCIGAAQWFSGDLATKIGGTGPPPQSTPPKFNIAPENMESQKETHLPTIHFQGLC